MDTLKLSGYIEGLRDLTEKGRQSFNKDELLYTIVIRQP